MPDSLKKKRWTVFGLDPDVITSMWGNVLSWLVSSILGVQYSKLLISPNAAEREQTDDTSSRTTTTTNDNTRCVSIGRPGGLEQLRVITLKDDVCTIGYNVKEFCPPPFTPPLKHGSTDVSKLKTTASLPPDCVLLKNEYFSVNYADCCIRWGLYESANRFVGWPIVPGFDVAGTVEAVGSDVSDFAVNDRVYGCTLFGAYSSRVLVPGVQLRRIPDDLSSARAASLPAASLTALYALNLAGHWPGESKFRNKAVLIHSAAGGVGSMLVQMAKLLGLSPVVGVVGSTEKIDAARDLGCDVVIDKSRQDLWLAAEKASPTGYSAIMDANGVSTLQESYNHLTPTGRLIVYGFHSNLPVGQAMLSPLEWLKMARKLFSMPTIDPMDLTTSNKAVLGFNLSFFADEKDIVSELFDQVNTWIKKSQLKCPKVEEMDIDEIGKAHAFIQSGKSIGKIVIKAR